MAWTTYKEKIKALSQQIIDAQKPIRILNAIKVDPLIEDKIIKSKFKDIPKLDKESYAASPLGFEPQAKLTEFDAILSNIRSQLGETDPMAALLIKIVDQYKLVIEMLMNRGTTKFYECSRKLYGSPKDKFADDRNSILDMAQLLYGILSGVDASLPQIEYAEDLSAEQGVSILNQRFSSYFTQDEVVAKISDGIVADAAAGGDTVKLKNGVFFSQREIDIYEVHEGWVHVGTTLNGRSQPVCKFLSIGPPRCASTQEGLAVLMEIFTFRSYPSRARQINDRILCIDKVEDGANVLDVIEYFRTEGYSEKESLTNALRVFRGGVLEGGAPFTKDISYCKGFVENYNFMRSAIRATKPFLIPFLFVGKIHVDDIPMLYSKYKEGAIEAPRYLPPHFSDLNGLAVWMSFSSFFNRVDLQSIQSHYNKLFSQFT